MLSRARKARKERTPMAAFTPAASPSSEGTLDESWLGIKSASGVGSLRETLDSLGVVGEDGAAREGEEDNENEDEDDLRSVAPTKLTQARASPGA